MYIIEAVTKNQELLYCHVNIAKYSRQCILCRLNLDAVGSYPLAQSHIPRPCLMHMYVLEYIFNKTESN